MAIYWREDVKQRWAVVVYADPVTATEWEGAMEEILKHPIARPPFRLLSDRDQFVGARFAVVGTDSAAFGMARMSEILSSDRGAPFEVRAFRKYEEAEAWLESPSHLRT